MRKLTVFESTLRRFHQLQELLADSYSIYANEIDLEEVVSSYVVLDDENDNLIIRFIPVEGDYVYVSDVKGENKTKVNLSTFSSGRLDEILHLMTKAFIMNEIKDHM